MDDAEHHAAVVADALRRLGRPGHLQSTALRLLAGGLSGAAVYRFDLAGEPVVLKVTPSGVDGGLRRRAWNEALFYRGLGTLVPVRAPRMLGLALESDGAAAILLQAHAPAPPAQDWEERDFVEIARQIADLHAAFWGASAHVPLGWVPARTIVTTDRCRAAANRWHALGERDDLRDAIGPVRHRIARFLERVPALDLHHANLPATLCHGDFHAENLLRSAAGDWIVADWQDVRLGPGVDDLSFLWQRAFAASDEAPPFDLMTRSYLDGLEAAIEGSVDRVDLVRALHWSELRSWVVDWPEYLGYLPVRRVRCIVERIALLIDRTW